MRTNRPSAQAMAQANLRPSSFRYLARSVLRDDFHREGLRARFSGRRKLDGAGRNRLLSMKTLRRPFTGESLSGSHPAFVILYCFLRPRLGPGAVFALRLLFDARIATLPRGCLKGAEMAVR